MSAPEPPSVSAPGFSWFSRLSIAQRLLIAAAIWGLLVLVGGALALSALYRTQTLSLLEEDLDQSLITLTREMTQQNAFLDDGRVTDTGREFLQGDVRYTTPLSGRYWAIIAVNDKGEKTGDIPSASLWDGEMPLTLETLALALADPGQSKYESGVGPSGEPIRVAVRAIRIENRSTPLVLAVAADMSSGDAAARRFGNLLLGTMLTLFGGVFAAMVAGIRFSLNPLSKIKKDIAAVREGISARLPADYPAEVRPLTEELNKLIEHNREVVERARTHVGNLAHALKTPLAVLRNEATGQTQLDEVVRRQVGTMQTNVEHYLKRARMAASAESLGVRTEVRPVIDGLERLLNRLFDRRGIEVSVQGGEGAYFRGEKQDFEEMIGNLMDNACKWARTEVRVTIEDTPAALTIDVEDDGQGLSAEEREKVTKRGVRLDETTPGTGLGLSIVRELAELYKGTFELGEASLGGLRARVRFTKS
jgi:signal transduction histidine kinase